MPAQRTEMEIRAADGTRLVAQRWSPTDTALRARLLVLHGYADHAERYRELALTLADMGIETMAVDLRGHGRSEGRRGYIESFTDYHVDASAALATLGDGPTFILGHSTGGLIALDWVASHRLDVSGLVVTNPYLELAVPVPPAKLLLGKLSGRYLPTLAVPSGIPASGLTHDKAICDEYERDPMVFKTATAGWFRETSVAQLRVRQLRELHVPLLYVYSTHDPIGAPSANAALAEQLVSPDKTVVVREGELHEVLNELDRAALHRTVGEWILARS